MTLLPPQLRQRALDAQRRLDAAQRAKTERYLNDPVAWAHDCIRWPDKQDGSPGGLTPYQEEGLNALAEHRRVAIRAPHGSAKSALASIAVWWMALTRDQCGLDWKIVTTAGRWHQLVHYLWPEIHKWAGKLRWDRIGRDPVRPSRELMKRELQLRHGLAFAVAVADPNAIEGAHADELLYVFDEAKLVSDAVFDAAEGAFSTAGIKTGTNAYALALSVPGEPVGRYYDICSRKFGTENWWVRWVRVEEAIAAGRVEADWVEQCARLWGEDSALYKNRCLGQFASAELDGIIPLAWVENANARWMDLFGDRLGDSTRRDPELGTPAIMTLDEPLHVIGVDVARAGGDKSVFALRQGNAVLELRRDAFTDNLMLLADKVAVIQDMHLTPEGKEVKAVVDSDGLGVGVYDNLRTAGRNAVPFHGSAGTKRRDASGEIGFKNVRAAAWWNLREMLDPNAELEVALPPDDKLTGDLVSPRKRDISGSRVQVEEKAEIVKRLGRSPDDGDAVVMAYWESAGGISWADVYEEIAAMERGDKTEEKAEEEPATEEREGRFNAPPVLKPKPKPRSAGGWHTMYAPPEKPKQPPSPWDRP
jgi:hypothetical protein